MRVLNFWRHWLAIALLLGAFAAPSAATTFVPPDFSRLVAAADQVVQARVVSVRSYFVEPQDQAMIETEVILEVAAAEKNYPGRSLTLIMLGGQVGEEVLQVDAMPRLQVGDNAILFVGGNGRNVCPLVGWEHGLYPVKQDPGTGRLFVVRANGEPLVSTQQVAAPLERSAEPAAANAAMSPAEFMRAVRLELEQQDRAH